MTVISTIITRHCTVHSSDSLISEIRNGSFLPIEWEKAKILPVPKYRGAMSYWGWLSAMIISGRHMTGLRSRYKTQVT